MFYNAIHEDMLEVLLRGDMKEIAEELTRTQVTDDAIIIEDRRGENKDDFSDISMYVNIANYIRTMYETDEVTDRVNKFLHGMPELSSVYFDQVLESFFNAMGLELDHEGDNTYNIDNDLTHDYQFRTYKDEYGEFYMLVEVHIGRDIRGGYTETVCLKCTDWSYAIIGLQIEGFVRESQIDYEGVYSIINNTKRVEVVEGEYVFYNEDDDEISLYSMANGF